MDFTKDKHAAVTAVRTALRNVASRPKPAVVVTSITRIDGKGALKGFATVTIAGKVIIHSCRIIQKDDQPAWVSLPQNEVPSPDGGKSRWYPVIEILDKTLRRQVQETILAAWQAQAGAADRREGGE